MTDEHASAWPVAPGGHRGYTLPVWLAAAARSALAVLLEEPFGFGPLRWRQIFNLEPHNSYIGSFANGGWLAGATFIALVAATVLVVTALTSVPAQLGVRRPVTETL